jgi:osmotically-inducible protein OsmY
MDDRQLRQDILDVFQWDPRIEAAQIRIAVDHGVVTLSGRVGTRDEIVAVEEAAQHVDGIRAIAQRIEVRSPFLVASFSDKSDFAQGTD